MVILTTKQSLRSALYCPREFSDDDTDMIQHVKQCLLKAQIEDDQSNARGKGVEKEPFKHLLKPKIIESLEKLRSKFLEEIKPFSKYHVVPDGYEIPQVIDDSETKDEIEIFEGRENPLTMIQSYTKDFKCVFAMLTFPFDTQVINAKMLL